MADVSALNDIDSINRVHPLWMLAYHEQLQSSIAGCFEITCIHFENLSCYVVGGLNILGLILRLTKTRI